MAENSIDRKKLLDDMKIERAKLFEQFSKHPKETRLALAIKIIDDEIADCVEWIRAKNKGAEIAKKDIAPLQENPPTSDRLKKHRSEKSRSPIR